MSRQSGFDLRTFADDIAAIDSNHYIDQIQFFEIDVSNGAPGAASIAEMPCNPGNMLVLLSGYEKDGAIINSSVIAQLGVRINNRQKPGLLMSRIASPQGDLQVIMASMSKVYYRLLASDAAGKKLVFAMCTFTGVGSGTGGPNGSSYNAPAQIRGGGGS